MGRTDRKPEALDCGPVGAHYVALRRKNLCIYLGTASLNLSKVAIVHTFVVVDCPIFSSNYRKMPST